MRDQNFRRIVHLAQPLVPHLENTDLVGRAETILDTPQDPVSIITIAFELKNDVHDVFQNFRPRNRPLLGDMADDQNRNLGLLGILEQHGSTLAHLADTSGRGFDPFGVQGLDRVDHDQLRRVLSQLGDDIFERRFAQDHTLFVEYADPVGAHFDLFGTLFARDVQNRRIGHPHRDLKGQGRFPDPGFAAQQHQRAGHQSAAKHPIDLLIEQVDPFESGPLHLMNGYRAIPFAGTGREAEKIIGRERGTFGGDDLFGIGVPLSAGRAFPDPFRRFVAAGGTEIALF